MLGPQTSTYSAAGAIQYLPWWVYTILKEELYCFSCLTVWLLIICTNYIDVYV